MFVPVFLLGEIQCLANLFFSMLEGAPISHNSFLVFAVRDFGIRGDGRCFGGVKVSQTKGGEMRDDTRRKQENTVVQEKQVGIIEGGGQEQNKAQKTEEKLDIFPYLSLFMHTIHL